MRGLIPSLLALLAASLLSAADDAAIEAVHDDVNTLVLALEKEDFAAILDLTHPKIMEKAGGRPALEAALRTAYAQCKKIGMKIKMAEFPAPPTFHKGTQNEFVIVPTRTMIALMGKNIDSSQYQLGIRKIGEPKWAYVDGTTLTKELILLLFPDFPKDLELPKYVQKVSED